MRVRPLAQSRSDSHSEWGVGKPGRLGTIVACVRIIAGGKATWECRTFDTTTAGLQALLG